MNALTKVNTLTMTSREIAELVELRHDNVKRTIETLTEKGVIVHPQIEDEQDTDKMGRLRTTTVYVFTGEKGKRDSIVVVAQLSPEFTARLVDRWQELENKMRQPGMNQQTKPLPPAKRAKEALSVMERAFRTLHKLGFDKNSAIISANQYTRKHAHIDVLADTGNTHLVAENQQSLYYTPTELGQQMQWRPSAQNVNKLLEAAGLQERVGNHWQPTKAGQPHARLLDTAKRHSSGVPIQQVKWADSVIPLLQAA